MKILIFKGLTARSLYKSFGVKGLTIWISVIGKRLQFTSLRIIQFFTASSAQASHYTADTLKQNLD
jgi:hypothetical protein